MPDRPGGDSKCRVSGDRLIGLLLFLPVPLVLFLFTGQPLGPWLSLGTGVAIMLTHRLYARPFALSRAQRRCLWCGGPAGGGPGVDLDEPLGRTSWRACGEEPRRSPRPHPGVGRGTARSGFGLGILGSLLASSSACPSAAAVGWPAGLAAADAAAVFRLGVALTVLPFGWLGPLPGLPGRPNGRLPFPVHLQALVGTRPGPLALPPRGRCGGSWPPCCTSRGGSLDRPGARALALPVPHGHPRAPLMRRDSPAVVLAGLLFFLSGAAALVYQVAWQRLLALHSGVGLYSVAMIVAAFMAGLGIGSHLGGRLCRAARRAAGARRVRRARARHRRLRRREHLALLRLALPAGRPPAVARPGRRGCCTSWPCCRPPPSWGCRCPSWCGRS